MGAEVLKRMPPTMSAFSRGAIAVLTCTCVTAPSPAALAAQGEAVPAAAVINGRPQGMFVGRSLLTGRAVCLLFLNGGRVTRSIPTGGLEHFDWAAHRAAHGGDVGTWQVEGGQLAIAWGDGGVHQGPLKVSEGGIEFNGKRYARPVNATIADLVGRWEAARGMAVTGGEGVHAATTLSIGADGRYRATGVIGGVVAGRAAAGGGAHSGTLSISGQTMTFHGDDGTVSARTLLPVAGTPITAMGVDADLFTRVE
jgi:hypothetical protein